MRKAGLVASEPQRFRSPRTPVDAEEDEVEEEDVFSAELLEVPDKEELLTGAEEELLDVVDEEEEEEDESEEEDVFGAELLETPAEELLDITVEGATVQFTKPEVPTKPLLSVARATRL